MPVLCRELPLPWRETSPYRPVLGGAVCLVKLLNGVVLRDSGEAPSIAPEHGIARETPLLSTTNSLRQLVWVFLHNIRQATVLLETDDPCRWQVSCWLQQSRTHRILSS